MKSKKIDISYFRANPKYLIPESLNIKNNSDKTKEVTNEILKHYFENDAKLITNRNFIKVSFQIKSL